MNSTRRFFQFFVITLIAFLGISGNAFARFEAEVCSKPKFTHFKPGDRAEVAPGSSFSFHTTSDIASRSMVVLVKGIAVDMEAEDREEYYYFKGTLPPSLKDTYARIKVTGKVKQGCKGSTGWLIKINGG